MNGIDAIAEVGGCKAKGLPEMLLGHLGVAGEETIPGEIRRREVNHTTKGEPRSRKAGLESFLRS